MNKAIIILTICIPAVVFGVPFSIRPGYRKPKPVPSDLANPFVGQNNIVITQEADPTSIEPPGLKELRDFIAKNPINGIAWHRDPEFRSAILGRDVILRVGNQIPRDLFPEGGGFVVSDISPGVVTFQPIGRKDYPINFQATLYPEPKSQLTDGGGKKK